jgi:hypothetical protein
LLFLFDAAYQAADLLLDRGIHRRQREANMMQTALNFLYSAMFAIVSTFGVNLGAEQPRYQVIERVSDSVEIRQYGKRVMAEAVVDTSKSDNSRGDAYRALSDYVNGANRISKIVERTSPTEIRLKSSTIATTVPIQIYEPNSHLIMRFFMPAKYRKDELPEPSDPRVRLIELPSATFAVLRFSGLADDAAVQARYDELVNVLQPTSWRIAGWATVFLYNPPWTIPFLRTNEIVVLVYGQAR